MNAPNPMLCPHRDEQGVPMESWILYDAHRVPYGTVCPRCVEGMRAIYQPEIFKDPNYEVDEQIEPN